MIEKHDMEFTNDFLSDEYKLKCTCGWENKVEVSKEMNQRVAELVNAHRKEVMSDGRDE